MSIHKLHAHLKPRSLSQWIHHISSDYGGEPDYSLRLPRTFRVFAMIGLLGIFAAAVLWQVFDAPKLSLAVLGFALLHASPALLGALLLWSTRGLRFRLRERMIQSIDWRGDEQALDAGTGSGITLIGCAQQLTSGKASGIDHWDPNAGGGDAETFWKNVEVAGVRDLTELHNMDIRDAALASESFDVIMSSFAVHHFGNAADRQQAAREMVRLLKPEGQVVICDVRGALNEIETELKAQGFTNVNRRGRVVQILTGTKH